MDNDVDYALALQLQQQFDAEFEDDITSPNSTVSPSSLPAKLPSAGPSGNGSLKNHSLDHPKHSKSLSIVDESWELIDPTPDVYSLFLQFNDAFFEGKLDGVEVRWSPRMTSCAGVCVYQARSGLCSVRLSVPLLKLRPRKDLVETLLHEMIHAYLFVTNNDTDRGEHGPEFHRHMNRINKLTGAKITIYHSFIDETRLYKQHWWRCNGPCQNRHPYYGYLKRASNRAPAPTDFWWAEHQKTCGGQFIKIKEPENYKAKQKARSQSDSTVKEKKQKTEGADIRTFFKTPTKPPVHSPSSSDRTEPSPTLKSPSSNAKNPLPLSKLWSSSSATKSSSNQVPSSKVHTFSSLVPSPAKKPPTERVKIFGGKGHVLGKM